MLNTLKEWIMSNQSAFPKYPTIGDLSSLADTVARAKDIASWTPDAIQLEKKEWQPVFICCQLGKGGREHPHIEGHYKLTDDEGRNASMAVFTKGRYELWLAKRGEDTYPVPLLTKARAASWLDSECEQQNQFVKAAKLKGKLYQIRSDCIFQLDRLRHNGVVFNRKLIDCEIPYRFLGGQQLGEARLSHEFTYPIKAWFYIAENDYWEHLIDAGAYFTPARLVRPRNPSFRKWAIEPYYFFNPREYANTE